jgi:tRNA threonylcarbamoyl adenosine modification protein YjeE
VIAEGLDEAALRARARALGAALRRAAVDATLLLHGPMGAGKTTFARALAEGLAVAHPGRVCSPTFTLCAVHRGPVALVHVDLFRLPADDDPGMGGVAGFDALADLDDEAIAASPRVLLVEWASRWRSPPADHLEIRLGRGSAADRRNLHAAASGPCSAAILASWSAACERAPLLY